MKLTTDFIRAAVEGITADGREITAQQITEMATSYNQDIYNARIWPEHIRGIMPDGLFKALGDVVAAKVEQIKDGALDGKTALLLQIEPHPDLITMVRSGQKVHLSIEMHPKFPSTNGAYLMGLGVTDSPASLGTDRSESVFTDPHEYSEAPSEEQLNATGTPENFTQVFNHFKTELDSLRAERDALKSTVFTQAEDIKALEAATKFNHRAPIVGGYDESLHNGAEPSLMFF
jgi:Phage capsid scaffolding protein (GPO) serine peptidase